MSAARRPLYRHGERLGTITLMSPRRWSLVASAAFLAGCAAPPPAAPPAPTRPARINHVVFFKLIDPADAEELITDCDALLATIPGIVSYYAGRHLEKGRGNVDSDYDVGLYLGFMSEEDYDYYIRHTNHVEVVVKWKDRLDWLRVHDVLDETP